MVPETQLEGGHETDSREIVEDMDILNIRQGTEPDEDLRSGHVEVGPTEAARGSRIGYGAQRPREERNQPDEEMASEEAEDPVETDQSMETAYGFETPGRQDDELNDVIEKDEEEVYKAGESGGYHYLLPSQGPQDESDDSSESSEEDSSEEEEPVEDRESMEPQYSLEIQRQQDDESEQEQEPVEAKVSMTFSYDDALRNNAIVIVE